MSLPGRWLNGKDVIREVMYNGGALRAPWRLLGFGMLLVVCGEIIFGLARMVAPWHAASDPVGRGADSGLFMPWATLGAVAAATTLMLVVVERRPWSALALGRATWLPPALGKGWLFGSGAMLATATLLLLVGYLSFERSAPTSTVEATQLVSDAVRLLFLLAPAALWEELVFRGYLWSVVQDVRGEAVALLLTSLVFGLVHLANPGAGGLNTGVVVLAGGCLGLLRVHLGLPAAWMAHLAWNWVMAAVLHMPVSGASFEAPGYRGVVSGPTWITGGDWGPEGGVAAGALLLSAFLVAGHGRYRRPAAGNAAAEVAAVRNDVSRTERS